MGWAYPDGSPGHETYDRGGIQAVTVAGRALLAGMYCDAEGRNRIDLRDTVTGAVIDAYGHYKEWWSDPSQHFACFRWQGGTYVRYIRPKWGYRVRRVTPDGYAESGHETSADDVVSGLAPVVLAGLPAMLVGDPDGAVFRDWQDAAAGRGRPARPAHRDDDRRRGRREQRVGDHTQRPHWPPYHSAKPDSPAGPPVSPSCGTGPARRLTPKRIMANGSGPGGRKSSACAGSPDGLTSRGA